MGASSGRPADVDHVQAALAALRAGPVADQEVPPCDEDRLRLLGSLLAEVELEITAATRLPREQESADLLDAMLGWAEQVGADADVTSDVLTNRLRRTALRVTQSEGGAQPPPGRAAAFAALMTAVYLLRAHGHAEDGDPERTRRALGRAEESLIDVQRGMHGMRVGLGDAPGASEE
ncbi:hypothetical protein AB0D49_20510 [Streptomyces sp. NPDC048290]|uniref:hypothetical protein n=1 Tax=Streptomyces sp. NPDC048290 TaxID=3155811 RepID=UPI00343D4229